MAFNTTNYVNGQTYAAIMSGAATDLHGTTGGPPYTDADTIKTALFTNAITNTKDTVETYATYSANEVTNDSGTAYTAGGKQLPNPKIYIDTTNHRVHFFDGTALGSQNTLVWGASNASFTAYGALTWDDTAGDRVLCSHYFGGAKQVINGTFTITWDATYGIFYATY